MKYNAMTATMACLAVRDTSDPDRWVRAPASTELGKHKLMARHGRPAESKKRTIDQAVHAHAKLPATMSG